MEKFIPKVGEEFILVSDNERIKAIFKQGSSNATYLYIASALSKFEEKYNVSNSGIILPNGEYYKYFIDIPNTITYKKGVECLLDFIGYTAEPITESTESNLEKGIRAMLDDVSKMCNSDTPTADTVPNDVRFSVEEMKKDSLYAIIDNLEKNMKAANRDMEALKILISHIDL